MVPVTRLEDRVCGPGLSWCSADVHVPRPLTDVPCCSPLGAARSGTWRARPRLRPPDLGPTLIGHTHDVVSRYDGLAG